MDGWIFEGFLDEMASDERQLCFVWTRCAITEGLTMMLDDDDA